MVTEQAEQQAEKIFKENGLAVIDDITGKPTKAIRLVARQIFRAYEEGFAQGEDNRADRIAELLNL